MSKKISKKSVKPESGSGTITFRGKSYNLRKGTLAFERDNFAILQMIRNPMENPEVQTKVRELQETRRQNISNGRILYKNDVEALQDLINSENEFYELNLKSLTLNFNQSLFTNPVFWKMVCKTMLEEDLSDIDFEDSTKYKELEKFANDLIEGFFFGKQN